MDKREFLLVAQSVAGSVNLTKHLIGLLIKTRTIEREDAVSYFGEALEHAEVANAPQQQIDQLKSVLDFVASIQPPSGRSAH
jgi:hypothetical protein